MADEYKLRTGKIDVADIASVIATINPRLEKGNVWMAANSAYKPKAKKSYTELIDL